MYKFTCDLEAAIAALDEYFERREALHIAMVNAIDEAVAANNKAEIALGNYPSTPVEVKGALAETVISKVGLDGLEDFISELFLIASGDVLAL